MLHSLLAAAIVASQTQTTTLYRGSAVDQGIRYWAVEDTFLDSSKPDSNFGRDGILSGGKDKTILIHFGDLRRVLKGRKVVDAKLVLTIATSANPSLAQISTVLVPWGEGPGKRGIVLPNPAAPKEPGQKLKEVAPPWSATWKHRRGAPNPINWQLSGAMGDLDTQPLQGVTGTISGDTFVLSGLGPNVQSMLDKPYENFGFAIELSGNADFSSSDSPVGQPQLVVTTENAPASSGADLAVTLIESSWRDCASWPKDGQEITWKAHVKNVGDAPADGFAAKWVVREKPASLVEFDRRLAPGEETTAEIRLPFNAVPRDHRTEPLALIIEPKGQDARPWNNALLVSTTGLPIQVVLTDENRAQLNEQAKAEGLGSADEWLQDRVEYFNLAALPQSRYSFAPEGALERFRIQSIGADSQPGLIWKPSPSNSIREDIISLSKLAGLFDFRTMQRSPGTTKVDGQLLGRGWNDLMGGLFGGDNRDDGAFPKLLALPQPEWFSPLLVAIPMVSNELFSRTDIAMLNANVGRIGADRQGRLGELPSVCLVRALDASGKPLSSVPLTFYQVTDGVEDAALAFNVKTGTQGAANLPNREAATGMKANPYGALDPEGKNGLFLVKAEAHGVTEWAWLPVWRFADEYSRGNEGAALIDLRFNLLDAGINREVDLASNKIVTDSFDDLPAKLVALVDGDFGTSAEFAPKESAWIEIDLGRDRPIGEICLDVPANAKAGEIWPQFEIYLYATGQKATEARLFAQEINGSAALTLRRDTDPAHPEVISLAYRGDTQRGRFLRLVVKNSSGPVKLNGIRVFPARAD